MDSQSVWRPPCLSWLSELPSEEEKEEELDSDPWWSTQVRLGQWVVEGWCGFPFPSLSRPLERKGREAGMAENSRSEIKHCYQDHHRLIAEHDG